MKDINDIMPKVPNMKWGALMNKPPTCLLYTSDAADE